MKVGDLVIYVENDMGGATTVEGQEGLIIGGPREKAEWSAHQEYRSWEVFWMYCNKTGWWDEFRLEVINES
jgi:hypothetical protein